MEDEKEHDWVLKMILIGDSDTGKSSIMTRLIKNEWNPSMPSTIGVSLWLKTVDIDNRRIKVHIWDTAGQEVFRTMLPSYYQGAQGAFLVYDITNRASFLSIARWLKEIRKYASPNILMMLIGNKCDLQELREVTYSEALEFAQLNELAFMETSALDATGINEAFLEVITPMHERKSSLRNDDIPSPLRHGEPLLSSKPSQQIPKKGQECCCSCCCS